MESIWQWVPVRETISTVSHFHYAITVFVATILALLLIRRQQQKKAKKIKNDLPKLTEEEKDAIIASWQPEPLVPEMSSECKEQRALLDSKFVDGKMGKMVSINGKEYLNLATSNFLGFVGNKRIEEVAKQTIFKYGVGSCGPRGFYGTVDVHLDLEKELAEYLGCEEAVLYSYGFATIASAIPAYAKRGDIIYADKGVNFAIQKGIQASRSKVEWFEHNNLADLERLLKAQEDKDKKDPKKKTSVRRFIIVEGLYAKTADLCPLVGLMDLKWKYKVRVFMDESLSFGVIGKSGKGVTEHFGVPVIDVDMIMASLENAIASTGGFCAGRSFVVGHQRLSGLGYCFSASLPPLLATAASEALRILAAEPERFERLQSNASFMHHRLMKACQGTCYTVQGVELSPLQHIFYKYAANFKLTDQDSIRERQKAEYYAIGENKLNSLVDELFNIHGIIVTRAKYLVQEEAYAAQPSVKVMCSSEISVQELKDAMHKIEVAMHAVGGDD